MSSPAAAVVFVVIAVGCPVVLSNVALIIIDVQNCFTGNGSLSVPKGEEIIPVIDSIRVKYERFFSIVTLTQDWHCVDHVSFASMHPKHVAYDHINLTYTNTGDLCESAEFKANYTINCTGLETVMIEQTLWPDHCIMNTNDAKFHLQLLVKPTDVDVYKGYHCQVDSYSGFYDNGRFTQTELHKKLQSRNISMVLIVGLALDYCVCYTAIDARFLGYTTYVVYDATRGISQSTSENAVKKMKEQGVIFVNSTDLDDVFSSETSESSANYMYELHTAILPWLLLITNYMKS